MSNVKTAMDFLWGDQPYFEADRGARGIVRMTAAPAMAYWMVRTLLWLLEDTEI